MPGLYTLVATRTDGETLTAAKYNGDHQNHIDNQELQKTDDFSATVGQMQTVTDPGEVGTESLASDASGELTRLRFAIKEVKEAVKNAAIAQWYTSVVAADAAQLDQNQGVRNLLLNGDVEIWNAGASSAPDSWTLVGAGASVARDATNFKTGAFAASVTRAGTDTQLEQDAIARAGGQAYIRSRTYTYGAWVRATVASRVRLRLNDGVGSTFSTYHTGGGAFEYLSVSRTLDALATALKPGLQVDTGDTSGQIDSAMLVEGDLKVAFTRHPQDGALGDGDFEVGGNVVFKSDVNFTGTLDHANTANRGYFFPDYNKDIGATVDATEVTADATEDTLKTVSIEGGKLGSNRIIRVVAHFTWDSGNATGTLRLKYGGTTVATVTTPAATQAFVATFYLYGDGGTSAQRGSGSANAAGFDFGTAAIDSTVNQNLVLTGQAQGADVMRLQHFSLEYL